MTRDPDPMRLNISIDGAALILALAFLGGACVGAFASALWVLK